MVATIYEHRELIKIYTYQGVSFTKGFPYALYFCREHQSLSQSVEEMKFQNVFMVKLLEHYSQIYIVDAKLVHLHKFIKRFPLSKIHHSQIPSKAILDHVKRWMEIILHVKTSSQMVKVSMTYLSQSLPCHPVSCQLQILQHWTGDQN